MDINLEQEKLGELLVERGVISEDELEQALDFKENVGGRLDDILVELDLAREEEVVEAVAEQQNMEIVDLSELVLPESLIEKVPQEIIEKHEVIPIGLDGNKLRLAIHDPFDIDSIEKVGLATDFHVEPVLAPRQSILQAINDLFYAGEVAEEEVQEEGSVEEEEPTEEGPAEEEITEEQVEEGSEGEETPEEESAEQDEEDAWRLDFERYSSDELVQSLILVLIEKGMIERREFREALPDHSAEEPDEADQEEGG